MPEIDVIQDGELTTVAVDEATYEEHQRFLDPDPGDAEGEAGRAVIYPAIDDVGPEWTIYTYRDGEDEPYTTTLHQYPSGVTECKIQHVKAKRLFDHADKVMNEFEFLDDEDQDAIAEALRGEA